MFETPLEGPKAFYFMFEIPLEGPKAHLKSRCFKGISAHKGLYELARSRREKNLFSSLLVSQQKKIIHAKLKYLRSSHCGAAEMNLTINHEVVGSIPGLDQWVKDLALL